MNLNCEFYIHPLYKLQSELRIGKDIVLKVLKPLYGVLEANNYWFKTYYLYYVQQLYMDQFIYNFCLL